MNNQSLFQQLYDYLYKKYKEWEEYMELQRDISQQSFQDFLNDFRDMNIQFMIYDIIGIIGFIIIILSYILTFTYIIHRRKLLGMPLFYFLLRFTGLIMTFTYAYLRNNLAVGVAMVAIFWLSMINFIYITISRIRKHFFT